MNPDQIEQIRLSVLRHLDAAGATPYGLSTGLLVQFARNDGFRKLDEDGLKVQLQYLEDKGFIARMPKSISPENVHWRLTAAGMDYYATAK